MILIGAVYSALDLYGTYSTAGRMTPTASNWSASSSPASIAIYAAPCIAILPRPLRTPTRQQHGGTSAASATGSTTTGLPVRRMLLVFDIQFFHQPRHGDRSARTILRFDPVCSAPRTRCWSTAIVPPPRFLISPSTRRRVPVRGTCSPWATSLSGRVGAASARTSRVAPAWPVLAGDRLSMMYADEGVKLRPRWFRRRNPCPRSQFAAISLLRRVAWTTEGDSLAMGGLPLCVEVQFAVTMSANRAPVGGGRW